MAQRMKDTVHGWVRENYDGVCVDDIINIICQFYLIRIHSNILSSNEQSLLYNLLFGEIKQHKGNENMKSIITELLYRGSKNGFSASKFHDLCDNKGATLVIIHNEYDHIFGGYTSKSWNKAATYITDPDAFLWMVKPNVKTFGFADKQSGGKCALWNRKNFGPIFGAGEDIWINHGAKNNGCYPCTFKFDGKKLSGYKTTRSVYSFKIKDYEVFSVAF